jgi:hypothetical protein
MALKEIIDNHFGFVSSLSFGLFGIFLSSIILGWKIIFIFPISLFNVFLIQFCDNYDFDSIFTSWLVLTSSCSLLASLVKLYYQKYIFFIFPIVSYFVLQHRYIKKHFYLPYLQTDQWFKSLSWEEKFQALDRYGILGTQILFFFLLFISYLSLRMNISLKMYLFGRVSQTNGTL